MALKATVYKADLQVTDMDRHHYERYSLTLAQHPSETDERLMLRLLAFALHADEALQFTKGISTDDEPDLWRKDLTGAIEWWIELGQPDEKRVRRAVGRAQHVAIYCYGGQGSRKWWEDHRAAFGRLPSLHVVNVPRDAMQSLGALAARGMTLHFTRQDGQIWFGDDASTVGVELERWLG